MSVEINGVTFEADNPCEIHTVTWNGRTFKAGSYLLAALFSFQSWLDRVHPGHYVYVIQGAYNAGVELSAGTHDKDGAIDALIINRTTGKRVWLLGQRWWRRKHFYAWWRHTGSWLSPSSWHFHCVVVGIVGAGCPVGYLIPEQIEDGNAGRSGLVYHLVDPTWRPKKYTPFDYVGWVKRQELLMKLDKDDLDAIRMVVAEEVERGWLKKQPNGRGRGGNLLALAEKAGIKPRVKKP